MTLASKERRETERRIYTNLLALRDAIPPIPVRDVEYVVEADRRENRLGRDVRWKLDRICPGHTIDDADRLSRETFKVEELLSDGVLRREDVWKAVESIWVPWTTKGGEERRALTDLALDAWRCLAVGVLPLVHVQAIKRQLDRMESERPPLESYDDSRGFLEFVDLVDTPTFDAVNEAFDAVNDDVVGILKSEGLL